MKHRRLGGVMLFLRLGVRLHQGKLPGQQGESDLKVAQLQQQGGNGQEAE